MPRTHKTLPRLYVPVPLATGQELALDREKANHLVNARRLRVGERCIVFNGVNGAFLAELTAADKKGAQLRLGEQSAPQPPAPDLWYGFAPLKAGRLDYMIQKATEMGAGAIQPVLTQFTQVRGVKDHRLEANAIEAAQQCEVLSVPAILPETRLEKLIADWPQIHAGRTLVFADEEVASGSPLTALAPLADRPVGLLIGPEGGFSEAEREMLRASDFVLPISLGPRILRADTAAVAALAVVQAVIGDWRQGH